ncbi:VOC family protein [Nakamurella sp. YIM 132087]|uniref:VOC family protein n=1 Tax=Nakamurella alba TaxID=2665158 RepID=A0A7K1FSP6_9ACTN|nr:VOC family protein [Nakamurella alba]MTD16203.1 VOC family protein [Nakamurella alba]
MDTTPKVTLAAMNMEAADPVRLAEFWAGAVGGVLSPGPEGCMILNSDAPGGLPMFFQPLGEGRPERQIHHLDLTVPWGTRESEVQRIVGLGAERKWDVLDEVPWIQWTTLTDPEGNLFCLGEHPPAG